MGGFPSRGLLGVGKGSIRIFVRRRSCSDGGFTHCHSAGRSGSGRGRAGSAPGHGRGAGAAGPGTARLKQARRLKAGRHRHQGRSPHATGNQAAQARFLHARVAQGLCPAGSPRRLSRIENGQAWNLVAAGLATGACQAYGSHHRYGDGFRTGVETPGWKARHRK